MRQMAGEALVRRMRGRLAGLCLASACAVGIGSAAIEAAAQPAPPADAALRIAVAVPITGPLAAYGAIVEEGARRGVQAIAEAGGPPIDLVVLDDAGDPARARTLASRMAGEGIVAVIGHLTAQATLEAAAVLARDGILVVNPGSTEPRLTDEPTWNVLRLAGRDARQGEVAARYLLARGQDLRVAVVHDKSAFGKGVADAMRRVLDEGGAGDVFYEGLDPGEPGYRGLAARIAAAAPTHVYFGGLAPEAAILLRDLRDAGSEAVLVGSDGLAAPAFAQLDPALAAGTLMTASRDTAGIPAATALAERLVTEARLAGTPVHPAVVPMLGAEGVVETLHPMALSAHAAVEAIAAAALEAGLDGRAIAARLRADPVETALGPLMFDPVGEVILPIFVVHEWLPGPDGGLDYLGRAAP